MADEGDAQAARVLALVERRSALHFFASDGIQHCEYRRVALAVFLFAGWLGGLGVLVAAVVMGGDGAAFWRYAARNLGARARGNAGVRFLRLRI